MKRNLCVVSACLSLLVTPVWPAGAQTSEADWAFLLEINEVTNSIDKETARQARAQCATLGKRLESMEIASSLQRLYFEAEIDHCVFYAMNNGEFSDETGDQCSYHYSYATKLAKVVVEGRGQPGFTPELMDNFRSRLENAARMGPAFGCASDYTIFDQVIAMAQEEAEKPEPDPPFKLWEDIVSAVSSLTAQNARDVQKACTALSAEIDKVPHRSQAERLFFEGLISDCVARAMTIGSYADDSGDACFHHFRFASTLAEGIAASSRLPPHAAFLADLMREDLRNAKLQGPDMGCQQNYSALKGD